MLAIFNSLGGGEVIAILIIGLIVLGPEKLPDAIRRFGNIYGEFRRMSQGFQSELRDAFDEPLQSLRGTAQMMQDSVNEPLQAITDMKAPVVGGGATAEPVDVTATELAAAPPHHPVVVEDRDSVSSQPQVGLEAGRPEPEGQRERVERVVGCVGPGATVGEADGWIDQRGVAGRHPRMIPRQTVEGPVP